MTRRVFLGTLLATFVVLVAIGVAGMLDPPVESRAAVDVPYDLDGPIAQPFEAYGLEGWLVRQPDATVRAFSAASPHRQCRVDFVAPGDSRYEHAQWEPRHEPGFFFDICFNSMWTLEGIRTFGPTPRGLDLFDVEAVKAGVIVLDLTRVQLGRCPEAGQFGSWCSTPEQEHYERPRRVTRLENR